MKFILSSWTGFEIDSSEFSASIETRDVVRLVKAFMDSPFIEQDFRFEGLTKFVDTFVLAKKKNIERFNKIRASIDSTMWSNDISNIDIKEVLKYLEHHISLKAGVDFESFRNSDEWKNGRFRLDLDYKIMIYIAGVAESLLKEYPKLAPELENCYYVFYRKDSHPDVAACTYKISLTGAPFRYEQNWNERDEWAAVLQSLRRKAHVTWTYHEM